MYINKLGSRSYGYVHLKSSHIWIIHLVLETCYFEAVLPKKRLRPLGVIKKNKAMLQRYDLFIFQIHGSMFKGDMFLLIDLKRIKGKDSSLEALGGKDVFEKESLESYL